MPTLSWIGKEKVINHHRDVPFKILEHKYSFSADIGESEEPLNNGNKIIHGDNLEALKSLGRSFKRFSYYVFRRH